MSFCTRQLKRFSLNSYFFDKKISLSSKLVPNNIKYFIFLIGCLGQTPIQNDKALLKNDQIAVLKQFLTQEEYKLLIRHFTTRTDSSMGLRNLVIIMLYINTNQGFVETLYN